MRSMAAMAAKAHLYAHIAGGRVNSQRQSPHALATASPQAAREIDQHVASRLRQRRLELKITQQVLAQAVGLSYQQIQKYETAVNRIGAGRLFCIAQALGVRQSYFFAGLGNNETLEERAIATLRGEGARPLKPAVQRAIFQLLDSLD